MFVIYEQPDERSPRRKQHDPRRKPFQPGRVEQGDEEQHNRSREKYHTECVHPHRGRSLVVDQPAPAPQPSEQAHRNIDQENRTPAQTQDIETRDHATEDLSHDLTETQRDPEPGQRPCAFLPKIIHPDQGQDLRDHDCPRQPLAKARRNHLGRGPRQATAQRGHRKHHQPSPVHSASAEPVTDPASRDQPQPVHEGITTDHRLQLH